MLCVRSAAFPGPLSLVDGTPITTALAALIASRLTITTGASRPLASLPSAPDVRRAPRRGGASLAALTETQDLGVGGIELVCELQRLGLVVGISGHRGERGVNGRSLVGRALALERRGDEIVVVAGAPFANGSIDLGEQVRRPGERRACHTRGHQI
jgi:hypothetical protein